MPSDPGDGSGLQAMATWRDGGRECREVGGGARGQEGKRARGQEGKRERQESKTWLLPGSYMGGVWSAYVTEGHRVMELGPPLRSLCLGAWQTDLPSLAD